MTPTLTPPVTHPSSFAYDGHVDVLQLIALEVIPKPYTVASNRHCPQTTWDGENAKSFDCSPEHVPRHGVAPPSAKQKSSTDLQQPPHERTHMRMCGSRSPHRVCPVRICSMLCVLGYCVTRTFSSKSLARSRGAAYNKSRETRPPRYQSPLLLSYAPAPDSSILSWLTMERCPDSRRSCDINGTFCHSSGPKVSLIGTTMTTTEGLFYQFMHIAKLVADNDKETIVGASETTAGDFLLQQSEQRQHTQHRWALAAHSFHLCSPKRHQLPRPLACVVQSDNFVIPSHSKIRG